ncbi:MAG: CHC2 zinc finger domain-containing protein [Thermodesulfovibrionales bacterium]|jgi:hypothetical protein
MADIVEVKQMDIVAYLASLGHQGRPHGGKVRFKSPFRDEKEPSFYVYTHNNTWFDWGLGKGGDIIDFVQRLHGVSFPEALEILTGVKASVPKAPEKRPKPQTSAVDVHRLYETLRKRTDQAMIEAFFNAQGVNYYPQIGTVYYPTISGKERIDYAATPMPMRNRSFQGLECREMIDEGKKRTLGETKVPWVLPRDSSIAYMAESILDALATEIVAGDYNHTLIGLNGVGLIKWIPRMVEKLGIKKMYLALDNDEPGNRILPEVEEMLTSLGVASSRMTEHVEAGVKDMHRLLRSKK